VEGAAGAALVRGAAGEQQQRPARPSSEQPFILFAAGFLAAFLGSLFCRFLADF